jgi:hypothetical protein
MKNHSGKSVRTAKVQVLTKKTKTIDTFFCFRQNFIRFSRGIAPVTPAAPSKACPPGYQILIFR